MLSDRYSMFNNRQVFGDYPHLDDKELRLNTLLLLEEDDDVILMFDDEVCAICTSCINRHRYKLLTTVLRRTKHILTHGSISLVVISCLASTSMLAFECVLDNTRDAWNTETWVVKFYYMCATKEMFDYICSFGLSLETVSTNMFFGLIEYHRSCLYVLKFILDNHLTPRETIERGVNAIRRRDSNDTMMRQLFLPYCTDNV